MANGWRVRPRCSATARSRRLTGDEHAVAVAVEKVLLRDRFRIRAANPLDACERGDEHDQRRFRQMEVGQQLVDRAELAAGSDEDRRLASSGGEPAVADRAL